jgi:hypothetical protein
LAITLDIQQKRILQTSLQRQGYAIQDGFLSVEQCQQYVETINLFKQEHTLPEIYRPMRGRALHYSVIDGEMVAQHLPTIEQFYREMNEFLNEIYPQELFPLHDTKAGANINITPPGGQYRWHYDRNEITALVYLNEVSAGEIEFYARYRLYLQRQGSTLLQRRLDDLLRLSIIRTLFGKKMAVKPRPGRLVIIQGNRCLHSVRPIEGEQARMNLVLSYDRTQDALLTKDKLSTYLYTQKDVTSSDPNYQ